jgi:hypothetical protein
MAHIIYLTLRLSCGSHGHTISKLAVNLRAYKRLLAYLQACIIMTKVVAQPAIALRTQDQPTTSANHTEGGPW